MSNHPAPYQRAHAEVKRLRGQASEHTCPCGQPASDWAYQFTGETLRAPDGSHPYSLNPNDYTAMCRRCHIRFDLEHGPVMAERRQTGSADGRAKVNVALAERRKTDPEFVERMNGVLRANLAVRVQCGDCDLTSTRPGMGKHQKHTGHTGRKELG
jgi:hypothetical protein